MKRVLSILMALLVLMSLALVPVCAAESAQTVVSVAKGDEVVYTLNLSTPKKVVGCDFSIYYDSSKLKVLEVADFTGNFNADEHQAIINPNIKDEVKGNFSILSGVRFNNRGLVSVKFEALDKCDAHISYYVRYLYPESMEMFTEYTFTCDVSVNKKAVIENAAPELNVDEPQSTGQFINSVTGNSDDANVNTAENPPANNVGENGGDISENDVTTSSSSKKPSSKPEDKDDETKAKEETQAEETSVSTTGGADEPESVVASPSQTDDGGIFTSVWLWIMIAIVLIGGAAAAYYFLVLKKKQTNTDVSDTDTNE